MPEVVKRAIEAFVLRLLGEVAARRDPPDLGSAQDHYRRALTLAAKLDMRPLVAHCHLGLGDLDHRAGDWSKAEEHLTMAGAMYRRMGMDVWLAQTEAALAEAHRTP